MNYIHLHTLKITELEYQCTITMKEIRLRLSDIEKLGGYLFVCMIYCQRLLKGHFVNIGGVYLITMTKEFHENSLQ